MTINVLNNILVTKYISQVVKYSDRLAIGLPDRTTLLHLMLREAYIDLLTKYKVEDTYNENNLTEEQYSDILKHLSILNNEHYISDFNLT